MLFIIEIYVYDVDIINERVPQVRTSIIVVICPAFSNIKYLSLGNRYYSIIVESVPSIINNILKINRQYQFMDVVLG
jgi:hypothetical protein